jgi:hypothetical protein
MDPVTLIVAALAAGASKGLTDAASGAVGDLYDKLKAAIASKFAKSAKAEAALSDYEDDPDTYEKPLQKHLKETGAVSDEQILALAKSLLEQSDPQGAKVGKYIVDVRGAHAVQIGDHGTQHVGSP